MTEPAHITRAKALLAEAESGTGAHDKPMGVITISDIMDAERRLTQAQLEVRAFTQGTDGMRETVDRAGIKGVVVERTRLEQLENLQSKVNARKLELISVKQAWAAGLVER